MSVRVILLMPVFYAKNTRAYRIKVIIMRFILEKLYQLAEFIQPPLNIISNLEKGRCKVTISGFFRLKL